MSSVLVFVESVGGKIKLASLELLSLARQFGEVHALALGTGASAVAEEAKQYGATKLFLNEDAAFDTYNPLSHLEFVAQVVKKATPSFVLASGSAANRDLFPRVAARLSVPYVSDGIEVRVTSDSVSVTRPFYAGKSSATVALKLSSRPLICLRPNQFKASPAPSGSLAVESAPYEKKNLNLVVKEVVRGSTAKLDLTEANIIVSGGRGMKGPEHFGLLNELADVLGATVGASRAVVDAGWVPHSMQVGQTGKTVAPSLYIACGISGAIQHLAGMSSSKVIVAINKDPEAPIFKRATYGIVGDVFEVLPVLTSEFKKLLGR